MKTLFATGLAGFVGGHLRRRVLGPQAGEYRLLEPDRHLDLGDAAGLRAYLQREVPDVVIHLAAQSFVPASFTDPRPTYEVNFLGTLNLFEALKRAGFGGRLLYVSSGDVYGRVADSDLPVRESLLPRPQNPYAVSKVAAEALCCQWNHTEAFDIVIARPFNHIGAGQDERFAVASFAKQVASIKLGHQPPLIDVGDIDVTRDFTDVEDIVSAYLLLLDLGAAGETYNIASNREARLGDLLEALCRLAAIEPTIRQDAGRLRRAEQRRMRASYDKLGAQTGWRPETRLETSLQRTLEYWEKEVAA